MENHEELNPDPKGSPADSGAGSPLRDGLHAGPPPIPPVHSERPEESDDVERPISIRQWLAANAVALGIVALVVGFVLYRFDLEDIFSIGKAALGLSFVVFIHELGHFLVAKWCDVHVTTFSIGFGPAIPGCSFQWGETTYKLALIPIGGYVQMVGQVDGDESSDGNEDYPRSFRNKSVGQRMAIISAGVIMNVILAICCFVVVFDGPGKDRDAGVIGRVDTGAPAFRYGLRTGAQILEIGNRRDPYFEDLMTSVMGSTHGERIKLVSQVPGGPLTELFIEPRLNSDDTRPMIGIGPPPQLQLRTRQLLARAMKHPVTPESAAANASQAFEPGDQIVATTDPDNPQGPLKDLPDDPRFPAHGRRDYFEFARRMKLLAAEKVTIRVERATGDDHFVHEEITVAPMYGMTLGARMQMGPISAIRVGSSAEQAGLVARDSAGNQGDLILAVRVTEPDGEVKTFSEKDLDPEHLPHQLKQWARRVAEAAVLPRSHKGSREVELTVRRHRREPGPEFETKTVSLPWDDTWRFDDDIPMSPGSPLAIPELGLAYRIKAVVAAVVPDVVPDNPLRAGDVIKNYRYTFMAASGEEKTGEWLAENLEEGHWASAAFALLRSPLKVTKVELKVERDKAIQEVTVLPGQDRTWPLDDRGWLLTPDKRRQKADGIVDAVAMGWHDTTNSMAQVFQNLRGMLTRRVSIRNLGGPLLIANVAYRIAGYDFWEFVFFLGLISVNLAVVNFLPVPVLDGGHFVFLIYEKLRGRPASEFIRVLATYAGLAMILSLFLLVTWFDIWRFF